MDVKGVAAFLGIWFVLVTNASSAASSLPLTDDAWINGNRPGSNFGLETEIFVHNYGPKYGLVRFDAGEVAGKAIESATLTLFLDEIRSSGTVSLYAITSSWDESTVTWASQPSVGSMAVGAVSLTTSAEGKEVSIDVTAAVRGWADGTLFEGGFLLATDAGIRAFFDAQEKTGGTPPRLDVVTDAGGQGSSVLDLSTLPLAIEQPGLYVLDRTWQIDNNDPQPIIRIDVGNVTLDMRGFAILLSSEGDVIVIDGDNVILRNGIIEQHVNGIAISTASAGTVLQDMSLRSPNGVFLGDRAAVERTRIAGRVGLTVGAEARVHSSYFVCTFTCIRMPGDGAQVTGNQLWGAEPTVEFTGNRNLFARNTIVIGDFGGPGISVSGEGNIVEGNVLAPEAAFSGSGAIVVSGGANILNGNILRPSPDGAIQTGMVFEQDGNFYGDNRIAAGVPFELGGTVQTDWGGNIGF